MGETNTQIVMRNQVVAEFTAYGVRIQLIAHDDGRDGYTVFTRVLNNWDLDDVDCYNKKKHAVARYLYLITSVLFCGSYTFLKHDS